MTEKSVNYWVVLFLRVALGMIFFSMGFTKVFIIGIVPYAETNFVEAYAGTWLPVPLLWIAGIIDPIVLLVGGILLILGLFTRWTCIGCGLLMMMIFFGHLVADPFTDFTSHPLPYLAMILFILYLEPKGNRISIDGIIKKR